MASPPAADPRTRAEILEVAARVLRAAEHVCVLTGAGISAESGIPTFREQLTGLWERYSPEELATPAAFDSDPVRVWQWYSMRRALVRSAAPNAAHMALAALAARVSRCTVITQNVDDLHERSGLTDLIRLHGSIMHMRCSGQCDGSIPIPLELAISGESDIPRCGQCGEVMRPDVVWFGEELPMKLFVAARDAAMACDVFLSVGTSNIVEPAASLPWAASTHGSTVIIINPSLEGQRRGPSILGLEGPAGVLLPKLVADAFAGRRMRRQVDQ